MKKLISSVAALFLMLSACSAPAYALEYSFNGADDYLFAEPTSQTVIYEQEPANVDRSKNAALVAPGFGSPTSYLPGSGEYLTPNLVPGAFSGGLVNSVTESGAVSVPTGSAAPTPSIEDYFTQSFISTSTVGFTEVSGDMYYSDGSIGKIEIPSLKVNVRIYDGTGSSTLAKGVGHFTDTSIWEGNVCLAAHNRGVNAYFGEIYKLQVGDTIKLTTKFGTRTYAVTSVEKVSETDNSMLDSTSENRITLISCVMNERPYRWCVQGVMVE